MKEENYKIKKPPFFGKNEIPCIAIGLMIDRDVAENNIENKVTRDVKLLSFKHTLTIDHIFQCPTQCPCPATTHTIHTHYIP